VGGKILKEFKDFAMKGNVVDMAVGIIIGAAFGNCPENRPSEAAFKTARERMT
jgi:hypothetical protein